MARRRHSPVAPIASVTASARFSQSAWNRGSSASGLACTSTVEYPGLLFDMAVGGLGIARLADFMTARALREGALVRLLDDSHVPESFPIHALTVPGRHRAPRIRAFVEFIAEQFGRLA